MTLNTILGLAFIVVGSAATLLMYRLWGYPYDAKRHVSAAPRGLTMLHRLLGLVFVAIYVTMLVRMVPRLWTYEGELPARTVLHVALGGLIGALLVLKVYIIRFARHLGSALPVLGSGVLLSAVVMLMMPLSLAAREWHLSRGALTPGARARVAAAVAAAPGFFRSEGAGEPFSMIVTGRPLLHARCTQCHDLRRIIRRRRTPDQWIATVERMSVHAREHRPIDDADREPIAAYLIAALARDPVTASAAPPPAAAIRDAPTTADPSPPADREPAPPADREPAPPADREPAPRPVSGRPGADRAAAADGAFAAVRAILDANCIVCHSGPRAPHGASFETFGQILAERPGRPALVVRGDPEASEMYRRIVGLSTPRMPITGPPWLSEREIEIIRAWIAGGAQGADREPSGVAAGPVDIPAGEAAAGALAPRPGAAIAGVTFAQVRPILAVNCMRCHTTNGIRGPAPEGLRLTDLDAVLNSPERPVVIPGNPGASLLLRHVRGLERPRMPFDGPPWLSDEEVALIAQWILEGARDDAGRPSPLPAGREIRLEGMLTAKWAVDGVPFELGGRREVRDARLGRRVEVRATVRPDGSLVATRVRGR